MYAVRTARGICPRRPVQVRRNDRGARPWHCDTVRIAVRITRCRCRGCYWCCGCLTGSTTPSYLWVSHLLVASDSMWHVAGPKGVSARSAAPGDRRSRPRSNGSGTTTGLAVKARNGTAGPIACVSATGCLTLAVPSACDVMMNPPAPATVSGKRDQRSFGARESASASRQLRLRSGAWISGPSRLRTAKPYGRSSLARAHRHQASLSRHRAYTCSASPMQIGENRRTMRTLRRCVRAESSHFPGQGASHDFLVHSLGF